MERTLVLIRHAKSDWSQPGQSDFDRSLNDRGKKDAPMMGTRLKDRGIKPGLIIASPAKRAASTAKRIAEVLGYPADEIQWMERLYHCSPAVFQEVVTGSGIADKVETVFIVAHNPGITHFVNDTLPGLHIDNVPTCGIAGITFDAESWSGYASAKHTLLFFDYPKNQ